MCHGTYSYELVCTSMKCYVPVHLRKVGNSSFSRQGWWSSTPSSLLSCMGGCWNMASSWCVPWNPVFAYHSQVHTTDTSTYQYKLVRTSTYWYRHYLVRYVQVHTRTYQYILDPDSSKNTEPAVCHWLSTREYIPSYTISCKTMIYGMAVYTVLYTFVLTCPGV